MGIEVKKCVIISAAPYSDISFYKDKISEEDFVICADGGYVYAKNTGIIPNLIVGDFDSSAVPDTDIETIILPHEKDDTDTMYAVRQGIKRGYEDFVFLGAVGGRDDHTFANYSVLLYLKHHNCSGRILTDKSVIFLLENEKLTIKNQRDKTFSIFPFACKSCGVSLKGFHYPLSSYTLKADFPLGISNIITSNEAAVSVSGGAALVHILSE